MIHSHLPHELIRRAPKTILSGFLLVTFGTLVITINDSISLYYELTYPPTASSIIGEGPLWLSIVNFSSLFFFFVLLAGWVAVAQNSAPLGIAAVRCTWISLILNAGTFLVTVILIMPFSIASSQTGKLGYKLATVCITDIASIIGYWAMALLLLGLATPWLYRAGFIIAGLQSIFQVAASLVSNSLIQTFPVNLMGTITYYHLTYHEGLFPYLKWGGLALEWGIMILYVLALLQISHMDLFEPKPNDEIDPQNSSYR